MLLPTLALLLLVRLLEGKVVVGVDILKGSHYEILKGTKLAALTNPTSLLSDFTHLVDDLASSQPNEIKLVLGPEHGFRGNLQAETGTALFFSVEHAVNFSSLCFVR